MQNSTTFIYHESRQINDYSIEFEGSKRFVEIQIQHKTHNSIIEKFRFPLDNLIESIEADRGQWLYETIGKFYNQDPLEQKFLEFIWDEGHVTKPDLLRLLCEELSYKTISQHEFCKLDSDRQKAYLEICDGGSGILPDWYKHTILLLREAKRNVSPENWETFRLIAA